MLVYRSRRCKAEIQPLGFVISNNINSLSCTCRHQSVTGSLGLPLSIPLETLQYDMAGFGVRVYPNGGKRYVAQTFRRGKTIRVQIGRQGVLPFEEAKARARKIIADIDEGRNPNREKEAERLSPTVAQLAERFLEEYVPAHCKPRTEVEYRHAVKRYILPALGSIKVVALARDDVAALHHELRDKPYQANRTLGVVSKMMNLAEAWGVRPDRSNPCYHIRKYKENKRERFLTPDELTRLGKALEEEASFAPAAVTAFTADHGLRYMAGALYRRAQPGRPWLNRMETGLRMAPPGVTDPADPARRHVRDAGAVSAEQAEIGTDVAVGGMAQIGGRSEAAGAVAETVEAGDLDAPALRVNADLVVGAALTGPLQANRVKAAGRLEAGALRTAGGLDAAALSVAGAASVQGGAAAREIAGETLNVADVLGASNTAAGGVYGPDATISGLLTVGSCAGCEGE